MVHISLRTSSLVQRLYVPVGIERYYFLFGKPIETTREMYRDKAAIADLYAEIKSAVDGCIRYNLDNRELDPNRNLVKRLLLEQVSQKQAPTFVPPPLPPPKVSRQTLQSSRPDTPVTQLDTPSESESLHILEEPSLPEASVTHEDVLDVEALSAEAHEEGKTETADVLPEVAALEAPKQATITDTQTVGSSPDSWL